MNHAAHSPFNLSEKTALVTGATGHLGRALTVGLARAGAHVLVHARTSAQATALVEAIQRDGGSAEPAVFDLTNEDQVRRFFEGLRQTKLNIIVNNAYAGKAGTIKTALPENYRETMEVSIVAVHAVITGALRLLRRAVQTDGDASVINISSMYGSVSPDPRLYDSPEMTNPPFYGTAKAALLQWTRYAACEFGPEKIRFNAVSPGPFPSPQVQQEHPALVERLSRKVPLGRIGSPEEVVGPVLFLASSAASYVTGATLAVDGGWTAW